MQMLLQELLQELAKKKSVRFYVRAVPGAPKTEIVTVMDDQSVKIRIAAAPEGGKANRELVRFLSGEFNVHQQNISIVSGAKSRMKLIYIQKG